MQAFIEHGHIEMLAEPAPILVRDRRGVDTWNVSFQATSENAYREGTPAPGRPGMIIDVNRCTWEGGNCYVHALSCIGNADGDRPTKLLNRGRARTLAVGWDTWPERHLSYHHLPKEVLAYSADNQFECLDHGFADGRKVTFEGTAGGAPVVPSAGVPTPYWIINATRDRFQVSATANGGPITLTTNMTAGWVQPYEFSLGAVHPKYPYMFVSEIRAEDDATSWGNLDLTYQGFMAGKVKTRKITVNGQTVSQESLINLLEGGGWTSPARSTLDFPQIQVEDITIAVELGNFDIVPTSDVLNTSAEVRTDLRPEAVIDDPPDVRTFPISGDLTYHWPNHWALKSKETVDRIPGTTVILKRLVWEYIWRKTF